MKKIISIMTILMSLLLVGCSNNSGDGIQNVLPDLSGNSKYDDYITNTLIPTYGIADLSEVDVYEDGSAYDDIFMEDGISDISFRDLNKDSINEMIVTIKQSESYGGDISTDEYIVEVYTIDNGEVIQLEGDIDTVPVLTWLEYNQNNNFNVFTKSYDSGEYLVVENYTSLTGEGGMGAYIRMYKMDGNELTLEMDYGNTLYYAMYSEGDYDAMTYIYGKNKLYSDLSEDEGYDVYNFEKSDCRQNFDSDVSQSMSEFGMGEIWSAYMQNYYEAMSQNNGINNYMKEASLRQSGVTDLFRMEYMPDEQSGGTITFYNYNGDYLSKFR
ncbi:MAG: hypothetical protein Q4E31_00900 [Intestinibacter bartlettii]|uniref:hypothetical protein n=1 Tax=Intestinibacter bartlettii TaxID=261299 RepID=UPI0026EE118A|nr:hypothetical protein [Intestinibacter bartlettii]MDO5009357.1 hypothetical protein [Intestinibacter bartlettii]